MHDENIILKVSSPSQGFHSGWVVFFGTRDECTMMNGLWYMTPFSISLKMAAAYMQQQMLKLMTWKCDPLFTQAENCIVKYDGEISKKSQVWRCGRTGLDKKKPFLDSKDTFHT